MTDTIIIEPSKTSTPFYQKRKGVLYLTLDEVRPKPCALTKDGIIDFQTKGKFSTNEDLFLAKIEMMCNDFPRQNPSIIRLLNNGNKLPEIKFSQDIDDRNNNIFTSNQPVSQNKQQILQKQLYQEFIQIMGYATLYNFAQAYSQYIWSPAVLVLNDPVKHVLCSPKITFEKSSEKHLIGFNLGSKNISIYNQYTGLAFKNIRTMRCALCDRKFEECNCCDDIIIKEKLHLNTDKLRFTVDSIEITNCSPYILNYVRSKIKWFPFSFSFCK